MPFEPTRLSRLSTGIPGQGSDASIAESDPDFSAFNSHHSNLRVDPVNGADLSGIRYSTFTIDPGNIAANVTSLFSQAVTGVKAGDVVLGGFGSSMSVNFNSQFYCESDGSVTFEIGNVGGATQNLSVLTVRVLSFSAS